MKTDKLILDIAGFNITATFKLSATSNLSREYKLAFTSSYKDFLTPKRNKKINFLLEFRDRPKKYQAKHKKSRLISEGKNKIVIFYQDYIPFWLVMQNAIYILCSNNNGIVIHASSAAYDDTAFLFIGRSGAGKSTIIRLLKPAFTPLSDDITIIRKNRHNFYLYQQPIPERNYYQASSKPFIIRKVYFLEKSDNFRVEKIVNKEYVLLRLLKELKVSDERIVKNLMSFTSIFNGFFFLHFPKSRAKILKSFKKEIYD